MRTRLLTSIGALGVVVALLVLSSPTQITAQNEASPTSMTPWGEPDLQGIWTVESDTPLQRPAQYANQEFFTEAQRAELDQARGALLGANKREERGTEADVSGAYNGVFLSVKRTGLRTSLIVDPPSGQAASVHAGGCQSCCCRSSIPSCPVAVDRNMPDRCAGVRRRQVRSDALAAARGAAAPLQHDTHESQ